MELGQALLQGILYVALKSNEILNYEMTQIDDVLENTDNVYMVDEWLWSLWEALLRKQRLADAEQVKAVRTQLAKQL